MRRASGVAALIASVLALAGCLGGGPSNGDVSKVQAALTELGPGWSVTWVTNTSSDSEGIDHFLSVGLHHETRIESEDLLEVFAAIAETLSESYRWMVKVSFAVGADELIPDLSSEARALGFDSNAQSRAEDGEFRVKVKELKAIVEDNQP
jgi:hypothetical protein